MFIPEIGVLLTGDLVFNGSTPYVGDADVVEWMQALTRLHAEDPDVVIPGHGAPGSKEILIRQRDWLEAYLDMVQKTVRAGGTVDQATDAVMTVMKVEEARRPVIRAGVANVFGKKRT